MREPLEPLVREFLEAYDALNDMTTPGTVEKLKHLALIVARLRQAVRP